MEYARPPGSAFVAPRRVVTAPVSASSRSQSPMGQQLGGIETLYSHPSVKIIAFTAGPRTLLSAAGRGLASPAEDVEPGSLPWSTQIERTIAVGPFRIYRAPGSVAFLNCGSALQPILPKSQCWCIDEISSKFVLQIRRPQYWRIEIPIGDKGESEQAQALRTVFDQVLQFEKTPCPFQRAFHVELPERPQTPIKKRPWTPVRRTSVQLPPTPITPEDLTPRVALLMGERKRRTSFSKKSETSDERVAADALSPTLTPTLTPTLPVIAKIRREELANSEQQPVDLQAESATESAKAVDFSTPARIAHHHPGFQASRSITAPPQLSLVVSSPPRIVATMEPAPSAPEEEPVATSPTDSSASFHSTRSWESQTRVLPPSPPMSNPNSPRTFPYPHENIPLPQQAALREEIRLEDKLEACSIDDRSGVAADNELLTSASSSSDACSVASFEDASQLPRTPPSTTSAAACSASSSNSSSPPRPRLRRRTTSRSSISSSVGQYRALSPPLLPSAANLFTPRSRFMSSAVAETPERAKTRLQAVRRIPGALIHKTCEILLSPPGHLVHLMLKVAARIAAGEWRGLVFGVGEGGEKIPVQWDYSDSDSPVGGTMPGQWDVDSGDDDLYAELRPTARTTGRESGSLGSAASAFLRSTSPAAPVDGVEMRLDDGRDGARSPRWEVD